MTSAKGVNMANRKNDHNSFFDVAANCGVAQSGEDVITFHKRCAESLETN